MATVHPSVKTIEFSSCRGFINDGVRKIGMVVVDTLNYKNLFEIFKNIEIFQGILTDSDRKLYY
jgi:hypothetical protein